jgi:hypothetical protein
MIMADGARARRRRRSLRVALAGFAAGTLALAGTLGFASGDAPQVGAPPSPDSSVFAGLDPGVVKEVLANPQAEANASINDVQERDQLWQGEVMEWVMCRQMFNAYTTWSSGGPRPKAPLFVQRPTHPVSAQIVNAIHSDYQTYGQGIAANDITQLRDILTNESGCGSWVPARPGTKGPVIGDVVRGGPPPDGARPWPASPVQ